MKAFFKVCSYAVCAFATVVVVAAASGPASARQIPQRGQESRATQATLGRLLPPQAAARLLPGIPRLATRGYAAHLPPSAPAVFGSDFGANVVQKFDQGSGALIATLVDGTNTCGFPPFVQPAGMWVAPLGRLWVANYGSSDVRMFLPGHTTSSLALRDVDDATRAVYRPLSVAVDKYFAGSSNYVYVGNYGTTTGGPGNIEVYPLGSQHCSSQGTAKYSLGDPQFNHVYFVATDHPGNLYVDYVDFSNVAHVCFITRANALSQFFSTNICSAPGAPAGDFVSTISLGFPGGMQAFRPLKNTLGVVDQAGSGPSLLGIDVYHSLPLPPAGTAALCTTVNPPSGFADPVQFAITDANGLGMWASDTVLVPGGALIRIQNASSTSGCPSVLGPGTQTMVISGFANLFGAAVSPPFAP